MVEPKADIYSILSSISGAVAYQSRPGIVKELPCFIFYVWDNVPVYSLDKQIGYQDIDVVIDIFADTSKESGTLLNTLEAEMLENNYRLVSCTDIPDDNLSHITTRFNLVG